MVRRSAYVAPGVVLMPCFVNVGAYVDRGTMVDTWATVGSCAQIGRNCHLSGGVGIGGVLEPLQAAPVIIEDDCFIGARSEVVEGVIVERGSVLSMGVFISATTKVVDRSTGEVLHRPRAGLFGGGAGQPAGQALAGRLARPVAVLRRHRQAGGRAHPGENLHQRAAPGLTTDPLPLAQALIRCASVTPADAGAQDVLAGALERLGFAVTRLRFGAIENLFARIGTAAASLFRRPYRRGAGRRGAWRAARSTARYATACCTAAAPAT